MSICTDHDPLNMIICIFSIFDQKRPLYSKQSLVKIYSSQANGTLNALLAFLFFNRIEYVAVRVLPFYKTS